MGLQQMKEFYDRQRSVQIELENRWEKLLIYEKERELGIDHLIDLNTHNGLMSHGGLWRREEGIL